jgi:ABC-2 type transport system permease protein
MNESVDRVVAIAARLIRQIRRDRRTLALIVIVPSVIMLLVSEAMPDRERDDGTDALDVLAPALIATFSMLFAFILTGVSFLRERTQGTLERLLVSPVKRVEIVFGYLLGFLLFGLVQAAIVTLFVLYVLDVQWQGSIWEIATFEVVLVITGVNIGILASAFARNEFQVLQFIPLVITPQLILGGVFWRVESMPDYLQNIAHALPLMYAIRALREMMLEGASLGSVGFEMGVIAAFAVGFSVAAALVFRRAA